MASSAGYQRPWCTSLVSLNLQKRDRITHSHIDQGKFVSELTILDGSLVILSNYTASIMVYICAVCKACHAIQRHRIQRPLSLYIHAKRLFPLPYVDKARLVPNCLVVPFRFLVTLVLRELRKADFTLSLEIEETPSWFT